MDSSLFFGYFGALITGIVLGLIGGGGSILTVPILVYLLSIQAVTATAYSLFVVGSASFVGAARNLSKGLVNFESAIAFCVPAVIAVFSTRKFLVPAIPEVLWSSNNIILTKEMAIMVLFALLMLAASFSMIFDSKKILSSNNNEGTNDINYALLLVLGSLTGVITGLVGAGGGFIIIPILVLIARMPMKKAVGTSLLIIALNSLIGFLGDVSHTTIDWPFLLIFTTLAIVGIFVGMWLNKCIDGKKLKKGFGWFVLVMGLYIMYKELFI
ncbi:sulfite exporter TauE/SafE family protein [Flavimarina sp. Hel_I_48]|uniref:sulfite exporter TauE/SafE family protein n=1 Tax=Flavimarina sp. Hel_I_48 TaxID=1392488 RepID=UPI0004DF029F|nr:sulfite exporter TauE/SafE family protein [Flavimarina sp. Hel_I_48]